MRAQFIFENIRFERTGNVKDSLDIGNPLERGRSKIKTALKEIVSELGGEYRIGKGHYGIMSEIRGSWLPDDDDFLYRLDFSCHSHPRMGEKADYRFYSGKKVSGGQWIASTTGGFDNIEQAKNHLKEIYLSR